MNAISKKLLSMLVVVTMVLSMVPFGGLGIFAVETEATSPVTPGQANLPEGITTTNPVDNSDAAIETHIEAGSCPMCGAPAGTVTWTKKTGIVAATNDQADHFYYTPNTGETETTISKANNFISFIRSSVAQNNSTMCIAIKSGVTLEATKYRTIYMTGSNNTLNIMGSGTVTANLGTNTDYGTAQIGGGTDGRNVVNLYGGNYQHVADNDSNNTIIRIAYAEGGGGVVNIYDGVTIGPATKDKTTWSHNVRVDNSSSTLNMYGGTIQNGVTDTAGISGNVTLAGGIFNMYGGTIKGGDALEGVANVGGNVLVGGYKYGNTAATTQGTFNMYGGTIKDGKAAGDGGNINHYVAASVTKLYGGTIQNGVAKQGGNIATTGDNLTLETNSTVLIKGGSVTGNNGGNIFVATGTASDSNKLTIKGGYIQGGDIVATSHNATNGGAIALSTYTELDMSAGEISGCKAKTRGGAIHAAGTDGTEGSGAVVKISGTAVLDNNTAGTNGGNINMAYYAKVIMTGGTVKNGYTTGSTGAGGNISCMKDGVVEIQGGSIFGGYNPADAGGSSWGGNIRCYQGTLKISGGYIYNGYAKENTNQHRSGNIGVMGAGSELEISGGNIGGDLNFEHGTTEVTLSGAPKIKKTGLVLADGTSTANDAHYNGIYVEDGDAIDISALDAAAEIQVTGGLDAVFTAAHENAVTVADCFTYAGDLRDVELQADNTLKIIEKAEEPTGPQKGVFDPWNHEGNLAYCDACLAQGKSDEEALVEWTAYQAGHFTSPPAGTTHHHLYLAENQEYNDGYFLWSYGNVCFNLNGKTITAKTGGASCGSVFRVNNTLNVIGTIAGSQVTGYNVKKLGSTNTGAVFYIGNSSATPVVNLYGGTYTKLAADTDDAIAVLGAKGELNLYNGATITAENLSGSVPAVNVLSDTRDSAYAAEVNIHDGHIIGGTSSNNGGSIALANSYCTLNMYGGSIHGGTAKNGGNINAGAGSTVTMSGNASVYGGHATTRGGNINAAKDATIKMSGNASFGMATADTGSRNVRLAAAKLVMMDNAKVLAVASEKGGAITAGRNADTDTYGSTIILCGNAKIEAAENVTPFGAITITYYEGQPCQLLIDKSWTGEASFNTTVDGTESYSGGAIMSNTHVGMCGTYNEETGEFTKDATATGTFSGILEEFNSNTRVLGVNGDLVVAAAAIGDDYYTDASAALTDYYNADGFDNNKVFTVSTTEELALNGAIYLDSNGYDAAVTGTGDLYLMDNQNDDYVGTGSVKVDGPTVINDVTIPGGNRYIVIKDAADSNVYHAHRVEIKLTHVTLRTNRAGLYYKSEYKCDDVLAERVSGYGVAVSLDAMPGTNFLAQTDKKISYTCLQTGFEPNDKHAVAATSGSVFGIFKEGLANNAARGESRIYANAYFFVDHDGDSNAVNDMTAVGITSGDFSYSLLDALNAIDDNWSKYADYHDAVKEFYQTWADKGMSEWADEFTYIDAE